MSRTLAGALAAFLCAAAPLTAARTLDIYFIDVEGGQSTLVVTPDRTSFLVDTGFAGDGRFDSTPGDLAAARDANRIFAAARDSGLRRIDNLLITHFHSDHDGGVIELAKLIPIARFIDHDGLDQATENVDGTFAAYTAYSALRATGTHLSPKPGDRIKIGEAAVTIVSARTATLATPLLGAGAPNPACKAEGIPAEEKLENPRSTGFVLQFGRFRFLDVGDLTGAPLFRLACPRSLIGAVDVYLVAHHGGVDAADPATFAAFRPRVAVVNNGPTKGGAAPTFAVLHTLADVDAWQLHKSTNQGVQNVIDERIANLDTTTSAWIKVSASGDGAFTVTNARTGVSKRYNK
jgi:beta-lactamase superfamily II metal-dependent hydrolase